uniref:MLO-like protein n=1 Tax=Leersia perrieri TaxID=77586 RepID=A0A0D9XLZ8_9ORYZ
MSGGGGGVAGGDGSRALDQTPTWAVAAVCAVIVAASILLEGLLHHLGQWFTKRRKKALFDALEKVKSELMTLGFISLLLSVTGRYISRICIPVGAADTMLPCSLRRGSEHEVPGGNGRRHLSENPTNFKCHKGMVSLVSADGLHQLHIFVFFLAVFHVAFSAITMSLGRAKVSFFRQFFRSVRRTDYLTLRHGFIAAHLSPGTRFNFRKYIKRSLEDDFKTVVGISAPLWASALAVMLFNVHGWHNLFWFSTIPLVVTLAVGTKLQAIIAKMAVEIKERHTVIQGMPVVKLSDEHFWFGKPRLVLHLIHFASFQNAFEITYFFWIWYEFGLRSCFHDNFELIIARVCLGVFVQFMCSYITLPLYALVNYSHHMTKFSYSLDFHLTFREHTELHTINQHKISFLTCLPLTGVELFIVLQMGSQMKRTIFDEQTAKALKKWHKAVVKKKQQKGSSHDPASGTPSTAADTTASHHETDADDDAAVPVRHLHRYKTIAHVGATGSLSDSDCSDTETTPFSSSPTRQLISPAKQRSLDSVAQPEVRVDVVVNATVATEEEHRHGSFSFPSAFWSCGRSQ